MGQLAVLRDELLTDPQIRGYAAMTDEEAADDLNLLRVNNFVPLNSAQIFESIDIPEFQALNNAQELRADRILGLGDDIQTTPGSQSRMELINLFGSTSATISTLAVLANKQISRAAELGLSNVKTGTVARART